MKLQTMPLFMKIVGKLTLVSSDNPRPVVSSMPEHFPTTPPLLELGQSGCSQPLCYRHLFGYHAARDWFILPDGRLCQNVPPGHVTTRGRRACLRYLLLHYVVRVDLHGQPIHLQLCHARYIFHPSSPHRRYLTSRNFRHHLSRQPYDALDLRPVLNPLRE